MGNRYGKLTVIAPAENIGTRTAWRCRCDCGNEVIVKTANLRAGKTGSCGCAYGSPRTAGESTARFSLTSICWGKITMCPA